MTDPICLVCGQPLAAHRLTLWGGVAHTVAPNGRLCSRDEGERQEYIGRIRILKTIIRSLRWRAGRLRGAQWDNEGLLRYADHWQAQIDRYEQTLRSYYARKEHR